MATKLTTVKRQSYTVSEKLRIIQFAEQHGNRAAEREFGVSGTVYELLLLNFISLSILGNRDFKLQDL